LVNLQRVDLANNTLLNGTFSPQCTTSSGVKVSVSVSNTSIVICGCAAASNPPAIYPPSETHANCLASNLALTLSKRILAFSQVIGSLRFTCNTDDDKNPYADCLNSMAALCDPARTSFNKITCQTGVNQMFASMGTHWENVRKECGQWSFTQNDISYTGVYPSENCATANKNLIANAYYSVWNVQKAVYENVPVTAGITDSINQRLWGQVTA